MPVFYITTAALRHVSDGQRHRGFVFETDQVPDVQRFAEALSDGHFVSGERVETYGQGDESHVMSRAPYAVGADGVMSVSEYRKRIVPAK